MNFARLSFSGFPLHFSTPLGGVAWAVLAGIPVGIIALYFLKLRRRPVQVPSTLLWRRSLEDLHVNSLFQRLRRNLLLFLQLLAVLLTMLALAGPRFMGTSGQGQRFVIVIDNSASMSATDIQPTRLAAARAAAKKVVQGMDADDLAMIISFSDRAKVVSNYTGDRRLLLNRIDGITPSQASTSLREALQVAAGLANPTRQIGEGVVATSVNTPKLFLYTDGGFPDVEGFSLGNLEPEVVVIGPPPPPYVNPNEAQAKSRTQSGKSHAPSDNVAILALQTRRNDERPDIYQVFGRVHNFRDEDVTAEAQLYRHTPEKPGAAATLIDAIALKLGPQSDQSFKFDLPDTGLTELEVRLTVQDAQPLDNRAFTLVGSPRKAQVLVVTPGNKYLVDTLRTPTAEERADVTIVTPEEAKADPVARETRAGRYDLVIYDGIRPSAPPEGNALYFGALPPGKAYENAHELKTPIILDWDVSHPLMRFVRDLSTVLIARAVSVELPAGARSLIDSKEGSLAFVAPREGYSDAVVTFGLLNGNEFNTSWFKNISFPLFLFNCIEVLGNARESVGEEIHLPDQPVALRAETTRMMVTGPDGKSTESLTRTPQGTFVTTRTDATGFYHARWEPSGLLPFAVNQFDYRESDLAPRGIVPDGTPTAQEDTYKIKIGYNPVTGTRKTRSSQKDAWWYLALGALGILLLEWYIYNRRVYV